MIALVDKRLIAEVLPRLRAERGLSVAALSRASVLAGEGNGWLTEDAIRKLERHAGRVPDAETLERLAGALEIEPAAFYEWPLAAARREARENPPAAKRRLEGEIAQVAQRSRVRRRASDGKPGAQDGQEEAG